MIALFKVPNTGAITICLRDTRNSTFQISSIHKHNPPYPRYCCSAAHDLLAGHHQHNNQYSCLESPVFCDTESKKKSQNLGRKQNSQNFTENMIFMPKMWKIQLKKSIKTKRKPVK